MYTSPSSLLHSIASRLHLPVLAKAINHQHMSHVRRSSSVLGMANKKFRYADPEVTRAVSRSSTMGENDESCLSRAIDAVRRCHDASRMSARSAFASDLGDNLLRVLLVISFVLAAAPTRLTMVSVHFHSAESIFVVIFVVESMLRLWSVDLVVVGNRRRFGNSNSAENEDAELRGERSANQMLKSLRTRTTCHKLHKMLYSEETFDLLCITLPMFVLACSTSLGPSRWTAVRGIRVCRTLRLLSMTPRMWAVVRAVFFHGFSLLNAFALLTMVVFVYAVIGGFLYADTFYLEEKLREAIVMKGAVIVGGTRTNFWASFSSAVKDGMDINIAHNSIHQARWQVPCPAGPTGLFCRQTSADLSSIPGFASLSQSLMTLIQLATFDNLAVLTYRLTHVGNGDAALFHQSLVPVVDAAQKNNSLSFALPPVPAGAVSASFSAAVSDSSPAQIMFILAYIFTVPLFLAHLTVAIFSMKADTSEGSQLLSREQQKTLQRTSQMYGARPKRGRSFAPQNPFRNCVYHCIISDSNDGYDFKPWVEYLVMSVLALDMLLALSLPQSLQSSSLSISEGVHPYAVIRLVFFFIYLIEWVAKVVALGPSVYLCQSDLAVVSDTIALVGVAGFLLYSAFFGADGAHANSMLYIHAFLKIRYLRLVTHLIVTLGTLVGSGMHRMNYASNRSSNELRDDRLAGNLLGFRSLWSVKQVFSRSLPALSNIAMVLGVFTGVFAVIGCCLFPNVEPATWKTFQHGGGTLDANATLASGTYASIQASTFGVAGAHSTGSTHFGDFGHSLLALVRVMSVDHWSEIYHDCVSAGGTAEGAAGIFFISFIVLTGPILGSLSASVVYDQFMILKKSDENRAMLTSKDAAAFEVSWQRFDRTGRGLIAVSDLPDFLQELAKAERLSRIPAHKSATPRDHFMEGLRKMSSMSSRQQSLQEKTGRFNNRRLVPANADEYWLGKVVDSLSFYAYEVPLFATFGRKERQDLGGRIKAREREGMEAEKVEGNKSSTATGLSSTKTVAQLFRSASSSQLRLATSIEELQPACWTQCMRRGSGRSQFIEVLSFSQVLVFLVQRRMQMHATRLQQHLEVELDKEAEIEASAENRQRAQRCPVCKMIEDSILDEAEQVSGEMELQRMKDKETPPGEEDKEATGKEDVDTSDSDSEIVVVVDKRKRQRLSLTDLLLGEDSKLSAIELVTI